MSRLVSYPSLVPGIVVGGLSPSSSTTVLNPTVQSTSSTATASAVANSDGNFVPNDSNVLLLYTGGTIGMKNSEHGYVPEADYFENKLRSMQQFHDPSAEEVKGPDGRPMLVMPKSIFGKRVRYQVYEYPELLDSCNMQMTDWAKIAQDIALHYSTFDAFIIIHGTDTMAYTASALSFMLENLGKSVILTGSQVPLSEARNDAVDNLLGALTIAGHFIIPEVTLYFHNTLLRGNRTIKQSAVDFDAFKSPNCEPLVKVGINIDVDWDDVFFPNTLDKFSVFTNMNSNVGSLRLFPGITEATVRAFLQPPMQGVVLETYGAGNAPDSRTDILQALKEATDRGVVIVNCTQCIRGLVTDAYATGKALSRAGVVPGSDMTTVCALTKLSYLLGKGESPAWVREQLRKNMRGELTIVSQKPRFSLLDEKFVQVVAKGLRASSKGETDMIAKALNPVLLCAAAGSGDLKGIQMILESGGNPNSGDYDHRTPLHLAAAEGHLEVTRLLLLNGASVHSKDRFGATPLQEAIINKRDDVAALLRSAGALTNFSKEKATFLITSAAAAGNIDDLKRYLRNGMDLNLTDHELRTPLHIAAAGNQVETVKFLLSSTDIDVGAKGRWGKTAEDTALVNDHTELAAMLREKADAQENDRKKRKVES